MRQLVPAAVVPLVLLATACSGEPAEPHTVVYEVSGSGSIEWIAYITDGRTEVRETAPTTPWTKTFTLPAEGTQQLELLIKPAGEHSLEASIEVDGTPLTSSASAGSDGGGTMSLTGELKGD